MLSFRLITTGLTDQHTVIGYNLGDKNILIQAPDGAKFSYEAMHDINGISIPELQEFGADRLQSLNSMLGALHNETVYIYYLPFIKQFIKQACEELQLPEPNVHWVDVYEKAKLKKLPTSDLKLATLYEHMGVDNLIDLYKRLDLFKDLPRSKRL